MSTIKCKVVADKVWYSKENRVLKTGDEVEFPAEIKNHEGKMVPFNVGPSFERIEDKPDAGTGGRKSAKPQPGSDDDKPDAGTGA